MTTPTVLHCFGTYLPVTENWAYRLIQNLPDHEQLVAAGKFIDCEFYSLKTKYLRRPLSRRSPAPVGLRRLWRYLDSFLIQLYPLWLMWRLRRYRIEVVHCHFADTGWHYRKLARHLNASLVVSFYGRDYEYLPTIQPEWRPRIRQLLKEADALVCEGPHGSRILESMGCDRSKIHICRLGIEPEAISYKKRIKVSEELRLLQVASFREKKGQVDTIRAFARALPTCPNATLTLVGSGADKVAAEIHSAIAAEGVGSQVRILDQIDFSHLHDFMQNYHVFIHPSVHTPLNDCEGGAPVVLLDAQATGMPVISTWHCDIPEEVIHGHTGLLSKEHDVEGLRQAIEKFYLMDQEEFQNFSQKARDHVMRNFDARASGRALAAIYSLAKRPEDA